MKHCKLCDRTLPVSEFAKNKSKKDGLQHCCRLCKKKQQKSWYDSHKSDHYDKVQLRKLELRKKKWEYLSNHPCVDCKMDDPRVLEFDHISDKTMGISQMIVNGHSWESILIEIAKCQVRCANCHKIKTSDELSHYGWLA
jgi:hypothetical protein